MHIKNQTLKYLLYTFVVHLVAITQIYCQTSTAASLPQDSIPKAKLKSPFDTVSIAIKDDEIKAPVVYKATDSIVYDVENKMLYLYGDAEMDYQDIKINSEQVIFNWTTQTLSAQGVDSSGKQVGTPVMQQNGKNYEANQMDYNFKTQKGKIYDAITEENGAFIHSEVVKKTKNNEWLSYKTKYTTCTDKEHPHFYIQARRAKIIPDKIMVSGAADLVISGINTPLALPFAIFPIKKGRRSGIIIPQFGGAGTFFTAKDGGYFWAINDNASLKFLGEIVTDGTFGVSINSDYAKRYKYSGNVSVSYRRVVPTDPIKNPSLVQNDFQFLWSHKMNTKADPNNNFSAFVRIHSNTYNRNQVVQTREVLQSINTSNINYVRRFNGKPYSLAINAKFDQSLRTHKFNITLPEVIFSLNKITPFKSKVSSAKKKFYEKIGISYTARTKLSLSTTDTTIFTPQTIESLKSGIDQRVNIDATYSMFKYFQITPNFIYNEQWFFKEEDIRYDPFIVIPNDTTVDTINLVSEFKDGFFAHRNLSAGISLSTKLTGIYSFKKGKLKAIRHVFTPSIRYRYQPDFSEPIWNYYDSYYDESLGETVDYNKYSNTNVYGLPNSREVNSISLSLGNTFDMKVFNPKDTLNQYTKIPLLRSLNISTGYNFAGDSTSKFQNLTISASTSIFKGLFKLNASVIYNPYSVNQKNQLISKTYWETHQKPLRFKSMNLSIDFNLKGKPKKKAKEFENEYGTIDEKEFILRNPDLYYDFNIPWSFYTRYHIGLTNGSSLNRDSAVYNLSSVDFGGDINITPKWKIAIQSGFDFKTTDLTFTNIKLIRDLHCWEMSLDWQAYPISRQSFLFELRVKSALLQDLKLTRKNVRYNNNTNF